MELSCCLFIYTASTQNPANDYKVNTSSRTDIQSKTKWENADMNVRSQTVQDSCKTDTPFPSEIHTTETHSKWFMVCAALRLYIGYLMQTDLCVCVCTHRGKHTSAVPQRLHRRHVLRSGIPRSGVTDCRRATHFLVSAVLLLSEASISFDTAGQSPSRNLIRERAEGVTNHITSTDSLHSLCSLHPVFRLCPYLSEWRFMVWPVGRRVMW